MRIERRKAFRKMNDLRSKRWTRWGRASPDRARHGFLIIQNTPNLSRYFSVREFFDVYFGSFLKYLVEANDVQLSIFWQ